VRLSLYNPHPGADEAPLAVYEAPHGQHLRSLHCEDLDGDGHHEIYSIWHTAESDCTSRILKWIDGRLQVVSETPEDPLALMRLRNRD
jgi:hypothetical protein